MFGIFSFLAASTSVLNEIDITNLLAALLASVVDVLANSNTTAVVFSLTGA
ncbi:MAG: hypothetical protein IJA31_05495 [Clostridia bacterium]|nr:hypothetical protein [Clostridia bacterium]